MTNFNAFPITNCPDGKPAIGYAYQPGAATPTNTGNLDIICEADTGVAPCNTMPGTNVLGDGKVAISTDWGNGGIVGCPNGRVMIELQCSDGTGALLSLEGRCSSLGYNPEGAYHFDSGTFAGQLDLVATGQKNGRPRITSFVRSGGMDQFQLQIDPPVVQSDCSPGTFARFLLDGGYCPEGITCDGDNIPNPPGRGRLYSSTQPCTETDTRPTQRAKATGWTNHPINPDGTAMVSLNTPPTGMCNFLGTTTLVGTAESDFITGFVSSSDTDPSAASPVAERVRASRKGNAVEVTFETSSELGLAGFNVYAAGKAKGEIKLNSGVISSKGVGGAGASYSVSFSMGEFKGNRSVIVESVMTDGTTLRAPKVDF